MATWLAKLKPETKVHVPPVYSHRSLRNPRVPAPSLPNPPKSQKFPEPSVQVTAFVRAPGYGLAVGGEMPFLSANWGLTPPFPVHWPALAVESAIKVVALYSPKSFR